MLGVISTRTSVCFLIVLYIATGCSTRREQPSSSTQREKPSSAESDWPPSARAAVYSPSATPSLDSPEGVTRLLEQRWSLADIRSFCIPERRYNPSYQNLVIDTPGPWKGRLYPDKETGFDRISWYGTVRDGRVNAYSLEVYRGHDFWLLEIGDPETVRKPPQVTPDPSKGWFVGHK
jgi:hypothetical protein